jgi:hypothetical protein
LPNVYEAGGARVPNADITVIDGSQGETVIPLAQARNHADLKRIAMFDTSVARSLLGDQNPLGFKPVGFDVFLEMARVYAELGKRLAADITQRTRDNLFARSFVVPESAVTRLVGSLCAESDLTQLQTWGRFGEAEEARLAEVQRQIQDLQSK